jgi:hypothetical protein
MSESPSPDPETVRSVDGRMQLPVDLRGVGILKRSFGSFNGFQLYFEMMAPGGKTAAKGA